MVACDVNVLLRFRKAADGAAGLFIPTVQRRAFREIPRMGHPIKHVLGPLPTLLTENAVTKIMLLAYNDYAEDKYTNIFIEFLYFLFLV